MRKSVLLAALLLTLVSAATCSNKSKTRASGQGTANLAGEPPGGPLTEQETRVQQAIQLLNQATDLMDSIRDRASATSAAAKLKTIAGQLQQLQRQGVPLGSQVQEKPEALGRFQRDMEKAVHRSSAVAVRLLDQENNLGPEFEAALREFAKVSS